MRHTLSARALQPLGYRAAQVLAYVSSAIERDGSAPSYREIRLALGIGSKGEVSRIVATLERRGLLSRVGQGRCRRIALGGNDGRKVC